MNQTKKLHPAIAALIVVVLVGIVASAAIVVNNANKSDTSNTTDNQNTSTATEPAAVSTDTSTYADGTYDATGSYISPGGRESIKLSVTIKDGVITETSIENQATDSEAKQYQQMFSNNYKELIVGKKVTEVKSLSRVAGSSLTSNGFNDALDQIKSDAKA